MVFSVESLWYENTVTFEASQREPHLWNQSKDKFLSAASSDGFGFCSVILWANLHFQTCLLNPCQWLGYPRFRLFPRTTNLQPGKWVSRYSRLHWSVNVSSSILGKQCPVLLGILLWPGHAWSNLCRSSRRFEESYGDREEAGQRVLCRSGVRGTAFRQWISRSSW